MSTFRHYRRITPTQNMIRVAVAAGALAFTALAGLGTATLGAKVTATPARQSGALAALPPAPVQPGVMLGRPKGELNAYAAARLEPDMMSVGFSDETTAWDFYHEAVSNGERVCLSDLGTEHGKGRHGQRYWLRTC